MNDWIYRYTISSLRAIEEDYWQAYSRGIEFSFDITCYNPFSIAEYLADFDMALRGCGLEKKFRRLKTGQKLKYQDIRDMMRFLNGGDSDGH